MARAVAAVVPRVGGVVVAPASALPRSRRVGRIRVLAGDHPVPGRRSYTATRRLLAALARQPRDATVLFLLSGGASALLAAPAAGVTKRDKSALNRHLLRCGAPIATMNAVRKHVSRIKGGGLARLAAPRTVVTLALSDVPGDDLATIGSGPGVADPTTFAEAVRLLHATAGSGRVPLRVRRHLEAGAAGRGPGETLKRADGPARRGRAAVIGANRTALDAGARAARALGYRVLRRQRPFTGEAASVARELVAALPADDGRPICVLAGGESHVTVGTATGRGGRSQELALAAAPLLAGGRWTLLAAGTDGVDGRTDAAGAFCDGATQRRGGWRSVRSALTAHDSWTFFSGLGDVFRPGPTGTNVMDLVLAVRRPGPGAKRAAPRSNAALQGRARRRYTGDAPR